MSRDDVILWLCGLMLGFLVVSESKAQAGPWTWDAVIPSGASSIEYVSGGMKISNGPGTGSMFLGRTFGAPAGGASRTGLAAVITEQIGVNAGGNAIEIAAKRGIPWVSVANAAVAVGGAAWAGFQVGAPIAKALGHSEFNIGDVRCTATLTGWQCDEGEAAPVVTQYCVNGNSFSNLPPGPYCGDSASLAVGALAQALNAYNNGNGYNGTQASPRQWRVYGGADSACTSNQGCYLETRLYTGGVWGNWALAGVGRQTVIAGQVAGACPAFIDALNPAYSKGQGEALPGTDGKCPTGRYTGGKPLAEIVDRIVNYGDPTAGPDLVPDILDKGQPLTGAEPGEIMGPGSITGQPSTTTTTGPDGTTTTTMTTPRTDYSYGPQTINYQITNTTTTETCTGGSCNTTTTEGTKTPEQEEACKLNPKLAICSELGDPPTDAPQWTQRTVDYQPEELGFGGSCPPPVSWSVFGLTLNWSYQPVCDVAPMVRIAILLIASVGAIGVIIRETSA